MLPQCYKTKEDNSLACLTDILPCVSTQQAIQQATHCTSKQHIAGSGAHTDTGATSRIDLRIECGTAMMTSSWSASAHNSTHIVKMLQTTRAAQFLLCKAAAVRLNFQMHDHAAALIAQGQGSVRVIPTAQAVAACSYDQNCKQERHLLLSIRQSQQPAAH